MLCSPPTSHMWHKFSTTAKSTNNTVHLDLLARSHQRGRIGIPRGHLPRWRPEHESLSFMGLHCSPPGTASDVSLAKLVHCAVGMEQVQIVGATSFVFVKPRETLHDRSSITGTRSEHNVEKVVHETGEPVGQLCVCWTSMVRLVLRWIIAIVWHTNRPVWRTSTIQHSDLVDDRTKNKRIVLHDFCDVGKTLPKGVIATCDFRLTIPM